MRHFDHTDPSKEERIKADIDHSILVSMGSNKNDPKSVAAMERFKRPPYYLAFLKGSGKK